MKRTLLLSTTAALLFAALPASAQEFSGDTKYACEAILCLSTGQRPDACMPSIRRYFSIIGKKPGDTIRMRRDFLKGCPAASYDAGMVNLVDAIANGAGRCDAAALNASSIVMRGGEDGTYYVSNALPAACVALASHTYTDATTKPVARYVGEPGRGGHWVEGDQYDAAMRAYSARIANEDAARLAEARNGGGR